MSFANQKRKTATQHDNFEGFYIPSDISDWNELTCKRPNLSSSYYSPTTLNNHIRLTLPQVSMKQCMFHICTLASMANLKNST